MEKSIGRLLHSVPNGYGRTVIGGREIVTKPTVAPSENEQSIIDRINSVKVFDPNFTQEDIKYATAAMESSKNDRERGLPDLIQKARDFSTYIYDNPMDTLRDLVHKGMVSEDFIEGSGLYSSQDMTLKDYQKREIDGALDGAYKGIDYNDPRNRQLILDLLSESYTEY